MSAFSGDFLFIDTEAVNQAEADEADGLAFGLAMDLISAGWRDGIKPFDYDAAIEAASAIFVNRQHAKDQAAAMRPRVARYFIEDADGLWMPSPLFFSPTQREDGPVQ